MIIRTDHFAFVLRRMSGVAYYVFSSLGTVIVRGRHFYLKIGFPVPIGLAIWHLERELNTLQRSGR